MAAATRKRTPYPQSCNNRASWHQSTPSPTAMATRCTQRCNRKGTVMWCLPAEAEAVEAAGAAGLGMGVALSGIPRHSVGNTSPFDRMTKGPGCGNHRARRW